MMSLLPFRNGALALLLALSLAAPARAASFPHLEADSMGGTHVVLPDAAGGKSLIVLLAFTREAQDDMKAWSKKLLDEHAAGNAVVYVVVVADKTGFFGRRNVRKMVSNAAVGSKALLDSNVLLTFDGTGWRDLTPPGDKHTAGVVVVDAGGNIVIAKREPYSDGNLVEVEKAAH